MGPFEASRSPRPVTMAPLTAREREVLRLRAEGKSAAEAAAALVVEPRTVKFHLRNVYAKLGIGTTSPAARQLAIVQAWQTLQTPADVQVVRDQRESAPSRDRGEPLRLAPLATGDATQATQRGRQLFRTARKLTQVLARGRFTLSAEVLPGTRILRFRSQARRTAEKFGVSVPPSLMDALPPSFTSGDAAADDHALDLFLALVERLRRLGAPGVHVFVTDPAIACAGLSRLAASGK